MAWLDPCEDILHLLRGAYVYGASHPPPNAKALAELLLLIVGGGMLLTILITGPMYLWSRVSVGNEAVIILAKALRLRRRIGAACKAIRERIEQEAAKQDQRMRGLSSTAFHQRRNTSHSPK